MTETRTRAESLQRGAVKSLYCKMNPQEVWWPGPSNAIFLRRNSNRGALCVAYSVFSITRIYYFDFFGSHHSPAL